jgi:hypothetical protein
MKTVVAFAVLSIILAGCIPSPSISTALPATTPTTTVEQTLEPGASFPATDAISSPEPTPSLHYGHLEFPFLNADAGNFQLQTGQTITFTWVEAPPDANYYEFVLYPLDGGAPILLGTDVEPSDGVSLDWVVPPDVAAELRASAYYGPDQPILMPFAPTIYSPSGSE